MATTTTPPKLKAAQPPPPSSPQAASPTTKNEKVPGQKENVTTHEKKIPASSSNSAVAITTASDKATTLRNPQDILFGSFSRNLKRKTPPENNDNDTTIDKSPLTATSSAHKKYMQEFLSTTATKVRRLSSLSDGEADRKMRARRTEKNAGARRWSYTDAKTAASAVSNLYRSDSFPMTTAITTDTPTTVGDNKNSVWRTQQRRIKPTAGAAVALPPPIGIQRLSGMLDGSADSKTAAAKVPSKWSLPTEDRARNQREDDAISAAVAVFSRPSGNRKTGGIVRRLSDTGEELDIPTQRGKGRGSGRGSDSEAIPTVETVPPRISGIQRRSGILRRISGSGVPSAILSDASAEPKSPIAERARMLREDAAIAAAAAVFSRGSIGGARSSRSVAIHRGSFSQNRKNSLLGRRSVGASVDAEQMTTSSTAANQAIADSENAGIGERTNNAQRRCSATSILRRLSGTDAMAMASAAAIAVSGGIHAPSEDIQSKGARMRGNINPKLRRWSGSGVGMNRKMRRWSYSGAGPMIPSDENSSQSAAHRKSNDHGEVQGSEHVLAVARRTSVTEMFAKIDSEGSKLLLERRCGPSPVSAEVSTSHSETANPDRIRAIPEKTSGKVNSSRDSIQSAAKDDSKPKGVLANEYQHSKMTKKEEWKSAGYVFSMFRKLFRMIVKICSKVLNLSVFLAIVFMGIAFLYHQRSSLSWNQLHSQISLQHARGFENISKETNSVTISVPTNVSTTSSVISVSKDEDADASPLSPPGSSTSLCRAFLDSNNESLTPLDLLLPCPPHGRCSGGFLHDCVPPKLFEISNDRDSCRLSLYSMTFLKKVQRKLTELSATKICERRLRSAKYRFIHPEDTNSDLIFELDSLLQGHEKHVFRVLLPHIDDSVVRYQLETESIGLTSSHIQNDMPIFFTCRMRIFFIGMKHSVTSLVTRSFVFSHRIFELATNYRFCTLSVMALLYVLHWIQNRRLAQTEFSGSITRARECVYDKLIEIEGNEPYAVHYLCDDVAHELYPTSLRERRRLKQEVWPRVVAEVRLDDRVRIVQREIGGVRKEYWEWRNR